MKISMNMFNEHNYNRAKANQFMADMDRVVKAMSRPSTREDEIFVAIFKADPVKGNQIMRVSKRMGVDHRAFISAIERAGQAKVDVFEEEMGIANIDDPEEYTDAQLEAFKGFVKQYSVV